MFLKQKDNNGGTVDEIFSNMCWQIKHLIEEVQKVRRVFTAVFIIIRGLMINDQNLLFSIALYPSLIYQSN